MRYQTASTTTLLPSVRKWWSLRNRRRTSLTSSKTFGDSQWSASAWCSWKPPNTSIGDRRVEGSLRRRRSSATTFASSLPKCTKFRTGEPQPKRRRRSSASNGLCLCDSERALILINCFLYNCSVIKLQIRKSKSDWGSIKVMKL